MKCSLPTHNPINSYHIISAPFHLSCSGLPQNCVSYPTAPLHSQSCPSCMEEKKEEKKWFIATPVIYVTAVLPTNTWPRFLNGFVQHPLPLQCKSPPSQPKHSCPVVLQWTLGWGAPQDVLPWFCQGTWWKFSVLELRVPFISLLAQSFLWYHLLW